MRARFLDPRHPLTITWQRTLDWPLNDVVRIGPTRPQWRILLADTMRPNRVASCQEDGTTIVIGPRVRRCHRLWRCEIVIHECCHIGTPPGHGPAWQRAMITAARRLGRSGYGLLEMLVRQDLWMHAANVSSVRGHALALIDQAFDPRTNGYSEADLEASLDDHSPADPAEHRDLWCELVDAARERVLWPGSQFAATPPVPGTTHDRNAPELWAGAPRPG